MTAVVSLASCEAQLPEPTIFADSDGVILTDWFDVFEKEWELEPETKGPPLRRTGQVAVSSEGRLFIPDPRNHRIVSIAPSKEIALITPPEGERWEVLRAIAVDGADRLYAFDVSSRQMTIMEPPAYNRGRTFSVPLSIAQFFITTNGEIAAYTPTAERVGHLFTLEGHKISSVFAPTRRMRKFYARIQTGGIAEGSDSNLYLVHPSSYSVLRCTPELEPVGRFVGKPGRRWQPSPPDLPAELSPYEFNQGHESWWATFTHIDSIFYIEDDLLLVTLFEGETGERRRGYANLYSTTGEIEAEGLQIPHSGRVIGARGRRVLVAREAYLGDGGEIAPFRLYAYRLRS